MSRPRVGFYWCASCGGCEEAVLDLAENLLDVLEAVEIAFWPVALDFKRKDLEAIADGDLAVSFINGSVRSSEQMEMAELMRRKSRLIIAFGSCAHLGGIPGLANMFDRQEMLEEVYSRTPSLDDNNKTIPGESINMPEGELKLPELWDTVKTLDQVIDVDYFLPGCPPPVNLIQDAVSMILEDRLPPKGAVLAPDIALCDECPRRESKPEKLSLSEFRRPHEIIMEPEKCLIAQGLLCLGPVTRKGCGAACVDVNMPCTGCMGATGRISDFGAKALSFIASLVGSKDEKEIAHFIGQLYDPAGLFYRYSLPASYLHRSRQWAGTGGEKS